jgi:hypothetical protein
MKNALKMAQQYQDVTVVDSKTKKLSRYMPWRHVGGQEVQLLFILNLGTQHHAPAALYPPGKGPPVPNG